MPSTTRTSQQASADVFTAIAHPVRREILRLLNTKPFSVSGLNSHVDSSQSALSQHLKILLDTGLVRRERDGREQIYHLQPDALQGLFDWVRQFEVLWFESLSKLDSVLDQIADDEAHEAQKTEDDNSDAT